MRCTGLCIAAAALLVGSGCSSTLTAWKARPFSKHDLDDNSKVKSPQLFVMTAERRVAVLIPKNGWDKRFCAESLPDAALAPEAKSSLVSKSVVGDALDLSDEYKATLTQTFARTEKAELSRQMAWQLCQAWAQGVLNDKEYADKLVELVDAVIGIKAAEQKPKPLIASAVVVAPSASCQVSTGAAKCSAETQPAVPKP